MKDHIKVNTADLGDWSRQIDGIAGQVGSALNVLRGLDTSADWWGELGSMRPIELLLSGQKVSMGSGRNSVSGLNTALRVTDSSAKDFAGKVRQAGDILTDAARKVDSMIDNLLQGSGAPDGEGGAGGQGGGGQGGGGQGGGNGADGNSDQPRNDRDRRELEGKVISHLKLPQDRSRWSKENWDAFNQAMVYAGIVYGADGSKSYVVYDFEDDWKDHKIGRTEYGEDGSMHKTEVEGKWEAGKFVFKPDALKAQQEKRDSKHNGYYDENGKKFPEKKEDSYANSKREHTLLEYSVGGKEVKSRYHDSATIGDDSGKSTVSYDVLKSETTAELSAGLYVTKTGPDGKPIRAFEPGVSAEIGWSGSVISSKIDNEVDVGFGKWTSDVEATLGEAEAGAKVEAGIINGKPVLRTKASAEVNVAKISASTGIETDVVDAKVTATAKVGFGAHVDVGYHDGVFKFDAGAAFGVGGDVSFEVNVGKTVGYVADKIGDAGKVVADTAKNIYNAIKFW
ncbi:MAG: hypothetical protein IJJ23_09450 [Clostridia bacterium]|nr:hypothetical protein [Clostridia bacterium]